MNALPKTSPQSRGWTPERKAKHAAAIRLWAPWKKSTGPKTAAGKRKSAANSYKHGGRRAEIRMFHVALSHHQNFIRLIRLYVSASKKCPANELLKLKAYLGHEGPAVTDHLIRVFWIMQKSCFFDPPGANS